MAPLICALSADPICGVWLRTGCHRMMSRRRARIRSSPPSGDLFPHLPWNLKKKRRMLDVFHLRVRLLLPFQPTSLHRSHPSYVPERSARLISGRLCVSCRVSPKALLAPLAQAAVRFQTARADGCLPDQSVLLSLISIFQTSIYFPLASQDQNSAELIIKALLSSTFIFSHLLFFLWKQSWFPSFCLQFDVHTGWTFSSSPLPQVCFNSTHFV